MAKTESATIAFQELKGTLKAKTLGRLYIFHGEETFLLRHYLGRIKKLLIEEITESFNFHRLTKETFDIRSLANAVESLPMMAEYTLVLVDDIDLFKQTEDIREKLIEILSDIPSYCTVVFTYETVQWKPDKRLKKLWEAINSHGSIVEFAKQEQRDLVAWITRHFAANQKRISPDLCCYLIDITGGTMTALAGEISKICAYSCADTVVKSDIDAVTEPVLDAVVFQMTDCLGEGKYGPALQKLHQLLKMQQDPIVILGAVGSHCRRLGVAKMLLDNGKGVGDMMRLYGIGEYPAKKFMNAARRFSGEFCMKFSELVLETDRKMKTSYDDQERLLELLLLNLAQEDKHD